MSQLTPARDPRFTWANPWVRLRRVSAILGISSIVLVIASVVLVRANGALASAAVLTGLLLGACWLTGYLVSRRVEMPTFWALLARFSVIAVSVPAPVALAALMRLSKPTCTVMNPLGLPWSPDATTAGIVICLALLIAAGGAVIAALIVASLRPLAIGLIVYGVCTFLFAVFAMYYGDPAPDCVPF
jgi:hypothetical protein